MFRLKKELAPTTTKGGENKTVHLYPIYKDLTKPAHQLLQDLLKDPRTGPVVWTIGGYCRYWLKNDAVADEAVLNSLDKKPKEFPFSLLATWHIQEVLGCCSLSCSWNLLLASICSSCSKHYQGGRV
jgi:hypothetical protein